MATILPAMQPFIDEFSQPLSQASSPASPTASFQNQQIQISLPTINFNGLSRNEPTTLPATPTSFQSGLSIDPPPGMPFSDYLRTWSDAHVARWLTEIKCGHHSQTFRSNDIRGDVLLDLDQMTLKEMGMVSVGDRIRVIAAVKSLRQRCNSATALTSIMNQPRTDSGRNASIDLTTPGTRINGSRRLDNGRPAPLHLSPTTNSTDLPRLIRDGQDSARATTPNIRPLPQQPTPSQSHTTPPTHTPSSRSALPPLPPVPRGPAPQPPSQSARTPRGLHPSPLSGGRRTPTLPDAPAFTNQPLPPAPGQNHLTPTTQTQGVAWPSYDPRQSNNGGRTPLRSPSPLQSSSQPALPPSRNSTRSPTVHNRNGSYSGSTTPVQGNPPNKLPPRPSTGNAPHPYAQLNSQQSSLSPIHEGFTSQRANAGTPPPGNSFRSLLRPNTPSLNPSLEDLKKKLIKFTFPAEGKSSTINLNDCIGGVEVLERALKKFGKLRSGEDGVVEIVNGGLVLDGFGAFLDWGQDASDGPLSEARLLSICHASPDDQAREHGLTLRQVGSGKPSPSESTDNTAESLLNPDPEISLQASAAATSKAMKRASSVSILSGLGVPITDPPTHLSPDQSPIKSPSVRRGPSKLRNFFGQRPPSELITTHLAEYFPNTEKKVLERTRRQSMLRASGMGLVGRRDSIISWNPAPRSRFSVSTQGSHLGGSPRNSIASGTGFVSDRQQPSPDSSVLELPETEAPPRVSVSAEDGRPILQVLNESSSSPPPAAAAAIGGGSGAGDGGDDENEPLAKTHKRRSTLQYLPPVAFPSESLAESLNLTEPRSRPVSRALSNASNRMSMITELRSKRDKSDTASMMTVDEITAEVESRRASMESRRESVGVGIAGVAGAGVGVDVGGGLGGDAGESADEWTKVDVDDDERQSLLGTDEVYAEEQDEDDDEEEDDGGSDETVTDEEEDETGKAFTTNGEKKIKWIKGALIGAGSFGKVYLGMDAATGLLMAVKQVELPTGSAPNEERKKSMLSALEREIELLKDLHHENIVQYHSSCIDDDHLNIFLEYVPGGSVTSLLRNYGAFEEPLVRNWVRQILLGLNYLHERDIIHRDIKGANMLVDNKGGIKISDFGISKKVEDNLMPGNRAHRPSLQGSVFWMAPEVVKQTAYTRKADIWSIGCLVVEMLTGEHPWAQLTQMQAIFKIGSSAKPALPPDISSECSDFLSRTFELDHEARPSAAELLKHPWVTSSLPPA